MDNENEIMNAIIRGQEPPAPLVKVFVRLGDDEHERTIAFRIPSDLNPMDLLDRGATIDGNQAILTVAWDPTAPGNEHQEGAYTCPDLNEVNSGKWTDDFCGRSMTRVLGDCQRGLVRFFKERGYTVQFA